MLKRVMQLISLMEWNLSQGVAKVVIYVEKGSLRGNVAEVLDYYRLGGT